MTDLLGPASAINAVTSRLTESRMFGLIDSWFKPCSSPASQDGTQVQASFLNGLLAQLRTVIRSNGNLQSGAGPVVAENNTDDALLLKAITSLIQRGQIIHAVDQGAANAVVANIAPAPPELPVGLIVWIQMAAAPTGPSTLNLNGFGAKAITRQTGAALAGGEWAAGDVVGLVLRSADWQIVRLTINDIVSSSTAFNNAFNTAFTNSSVVQNYINKSTTRGETHIYANASGLVVSDIAVSPANSTVLTSGAFSGATFVTGDASVALRDNDTTGFFLGYVAQVQLNDLTAGSSQAFNAYVGASTATTTVPIQLPFPLPYTFQGLNAAHSYSLSIIARKATSNGPVNAYDATINGYHDGSNS